MDYFTDRYPTEHIHTYYFNNGYHDAQLNFVCRVEPLISTLTKKFLGLTENEISPNKGLFFVTSRILETLLRDKNQGAIAGEVIKAMRSSGLLDAEIEVQSKKFSNFTAIHESYTVMESQIRNIQYEKELCEKEIVRLKEQVDFQGQIIIRLQNELDSVNNSGQQIN